MNTLEDRLRDAYQAAAQTVRAESVLAEGIRPAHGHGRQAHSRRRLIPFAAAAAVIAVIIGTTVLAQHAGPASNGASGTRTAQLAAGTPKYFVAVTSTLHPVMSVVNAATGTQGQTVRLPSPGNWVSVATGDGRTFVAAATRPHTCATTLYKFGVNRAGHASTPAKITTLHGVIYFPQDLAAAGDGQAIAYAMSPYAPGCPHSGGSAYDGDLYVLNLATGHSKHWSYSINNIWQLTYHTGVTLSEDGSRVAFGNWVLHTSAPEGSLEARGQMLIHKGVFPGFSHGSWTNIEGLNLAPNGKAVYFATSWQPLRPPRHRVWRLWVLSLATERISLLHTFPGLLPDSLTPDPTGRYVLISYLPPGGPQRVARLDPTTGKMTQLNAAWDIQSQIAW